MRRKGSTSRAILPPGRPQTHGGHSILTLKGILPEHRREVARYLTTVRIGLCRDLGPTEADLTTAQIILIDRTVTALGIVRCVEEYIRENSVMVGRDVAPALQQSYLAYVNHVRLNLVALGIKTKAGEGILDLQAYVREHDRLKDREKAAQADKDKSETKARQASHKARQGQAEAEESDIGNQAGQEIVDPGAPGGDIPEQRQDRAGIEGKPS